jgi:phenylalanyl-tRNA synthetase alpha chain
LNLQQIYQSKRKKNKDAKSSPKASSKKVTPPPAVSKSTGSGSGSSGGGAEDNTDVLVNALIEVLYKDNKIDSSIEFANMKKVDHQEIVRAIKTLEAAFYVITDKKQNDFYELTSEGITMIENGMTPEMKLFLALTEQGIETNELTRIVGKDVVQIGMGPNMKNKWAQKKGSLIIRVAHPDEVKDEVLEQLQMVKSGNHNLNEKLLSALAKRKLIAKKKITYFQVNKGPSYAPVFRKQEAELTVAMMKSGDWKTIPLKEYNFNAKGAPVGGGYFHPLLKVRAEFRRILIGMGFEEMPTNRWVESSFWNFDSLFQPQSHPARDAHDTFFVKDPAETLTVPDDYYERVKTQHETGGHGSIGYRTPFKKQEAFKNLLRTHTTAISAQMLYKLANQEGGFKPQKYFSIDRVFRNESMDKTHLCEFHQVEGLVADYNLSLKDLIGMIRTFFESIGITQLRFKPAFNPYTEPSMEVFGFHPDLKCWTEIGNSGMFRPEMLAPMGLPSNVRVIAWGLSLERPTMIKYRISNIRDLFGHQVDVNQTMDAPLARFP